MPNKAATGSNQRVQGTIFKKCDRSRHNPADSKACAARDAGETRGACQHTCHPHQIDTCRHAGTVRYSVAGRQREESFEDELYPGTKRRPVHHLNGRDRPASASRADQADAAVPARP